MTIKCTPKRDGVEGNGQKQEIDYGGVNRGRRRGLFRMCPIIFYPVSLNSVVMVDSGPNHDAALFCLALFSVDRVRAR